MIIRASIALLAIAVTSACSDDSSSSASSGSPANLVAGSSPALSSDDNSYRNFKEIGLVPGSIPAHGDARAYADFSGDGDVDYFVATLTYSPGSSTPDTATPGTFSIWERQPDNSFLLDSARLPVNTGCIHPRKAVVADFNLDGKPDVFVACHGYDANPFPGEKNKIVLSQLDGTYLTLDASSDIGFFHSATAADLNGDTYPDVLVVNNFDSRAAFVLLNNQNGTFIRESGTRLPLQLGGKNYYTIELADISGDGILDLLVGGHEFDGAATRAYVNPGNNIFEGVSPTIIPAVANEGVVLDFAVTGSGGAKALWVLRTSGGDGTFYQSKVLQRYDVAASSSSVVINTRGAGWVAWIIPAVVATKNVISSDKSSDSFMYEY